MYTVLTNSFFHVDGTTGLETMSRSKNLQDFRSLNTAPIAATSSQYVTLSGEFPTSVRPSRSLLVPRTWILIRKFGCSTLGTVQSIANIEAYKMGDHVSFWVFLTHTS